MNTAHHTASVAPTLARDFTGNRTLEALDLADVGTRYNEPDGKPAPKSYDCRIRLGTGGVSITSPKTGQTLTVPCEAAPVRVRQRIVHARSTGRPTLTFTLDELRAFATAAAEAPATAPASVAVPVVPVPLHGGGHRARRSRRTARVA